MSEQLTFAGTGISMDLGWGSCLTTGTRENVRTGSLLRSKDDDLCPVKMLEIKFKLMLFSVMYSNLEGGVKVGGKCTLDLGAPRLMLTWIREIS